MNTSACRTVKHHITQISGTKTDLVNQDDCLPGRGDVEGAVKGLIDFCGSDTQISGPNNVQWFANVL